jgi:hypothetical protein
VIKTLATRWERRTFHVLVNMAASAADAEATFAASPPSRAFPSVRLDFAGWVPFDESWTARVRAHTPFVLASPGAPPPRDRRAGRRSAAADRPSRAASVFPPPRGRAGLSDGDDGHTDAGRRAARRGRAADDVPTLQGDREDHPPSLPPARPPRRGRASPSGSRRTSSSTTSCRGHRRLLDAIVKYDRGRKRFLDLRAVPHPRRDPRPPASLDWVRAACARRPRHREGSHDSEGRSAARDGRGDRARARASLAQYQELLGKVGEMTLFSLEDLGFGGRRGALGND